MTNALPRVLVPDVDPLYPGILDFTFSFKFRLHLPAGLFTAMLPGNYGPFLGYHKNQYFVNKSNAGVLNLVAWSGYNKPGVNKPFYNSANDTDVSAVPGVTKPLILAISPDTTYSCSFARNLPFLTGAGASLNFSNGVTSASTTAVGRHKTLYRSTNGYSIYSGVYETYQAFPSEYGPVTMYLDDIALSIGSMTKNGLSYRIRVEGYTDLTLFSLGG